jgi:hypothetical protein
MFLHLNGWPKNGKAARRGRDEPAPSRPRRHPGYENCVTPGRATGGTGIGPHS